MSEYRVAGHRYAAGDSREMQKLEAANRAAKQELDISVIEARANATYEWFTLWDCDPGPVISCGAIRIHFQRIDRVSDDEVNALAEFVAHSREDISVLTKRAREQEERIRELEANLDVWMRRYGAER
jgi:hypothetical protein